MTMIPVLQTNNPLLHQRAKLVIDFRSVEVSQTINNLIDTMRATNLVGMAAPQIGSSWQIFVTEIRQTKYRNPEEIDKLRVFINPELDWLSTKTMTDFEGCGSVKEPALFAKITRAESIKVKAFDIEGKQFDFVAHGLLARVIQHEVDHLHGIICLEKQEEIITEEQYLTMLKTND